MSTSAIKQLNLHGISFQIHEYDHDPTTASYGLEAAQKLGLPSEKVFKTLIAQIDQGYAVAVIPVDRQVSLKLFAKAVQSKKAMMAKPEVASRITGYLVGGISPIGQKKLLVTVIDESALLQSTILVSGGKRGLDIEIGTAALAEITKAIFADIAQ